MDELAQCYNVVPQLDINNTIDHRPEGDEKWFLENEKTVTQFCRKLAAERPDRKSGSAGMPRPTSYAVCCLKKKVGEGRIGAIRLGERFYSGEGRAGGREVPRYDVGGMTLTVQQSGVTPTKH